MVDILKYFLLTFEIVVSLMLLLVILVQKTKSGGGMGASFGGGLGESMFGSRAGNVLTKATVILATVFMLNTLGLAVLFSSNDAEIIQAPMGPATGPAPVPVPAAPEDTGAAPASTPVPASAPTPAPVESE